MTNIFDQFDAEPGAAVPGGNIFDQFDEPANPAARSGLALNSTAGLNSAIYNTAGLPVDLTRGAINLGISGINAATGADIRHLPSDGFMGSEWISNRMGDIHPVLDPANTEATTTGERIARGVGEGVGYTVAPQTAVGGLLRAGGGRAVESAARFIGQPGSLRAAGGEMLAGGSAGGGASLGMEVAPDRYDALAATAGGLAGGLLGTAIASAPAIGRAAREAFSDFTAPMRESGRQGIAARQLYDAATDPSAVRQMLDDGIDDLVPGSNPTTFQATGDLGLGGMERGAAARRPDLFAQRRAEQNSARLSHLGSIQENGAPEAVAKAVRDHLARIDDETQHALNAATQSARQSAGNVGSGLSPDAAGSNIRQALEAARAAAKDQERALWQAVDPDGSLALAARGTKQAARSIADDLPRSAKPMTGEEASIHGVLQHYDEVVPFGELTALQSRIKSELRAERLANGESPAYRRLTRLNRAIEGDLETAIAGKVAQEADAVARGVMDEQNTLLAKLRDEVFAFRDRRYAATGEVDGAGSRGPAIGRSSGISGAPRAEGETFGGFGSSPRDPRLSGDDLQPNFDEAALGRLREARHATRTRVETFDNKTLGPIRRRPSTTAPYDLPTGTVPERIFNASSSSPEAIRRFRNAVGDEQALPVIQEYAVDRLRAFAMDADGTLNPARVTAWRRRHQEALRSFPELDARLGDAARASEAIEQVGRTRKLRLDDARKGKLGALLNVDDPTDIVNTVGGVFGRSDSLQQMSRIRSAIGSDKEALEGLKKATVDYMTGRFVGNTEVATSGQAGIRSDQFQSFLKQSKQALRLAGFSADDVGRMQAIADDLSRANRSIAGVRIPGGSNTTQDMIAAGNRSVSNLGKLLSVAAAGVGSYVSGPLASMAGVMGGQAVSAMRQAGLHTVDDLIADAMLNPNVAKLLLSNVPSKPDHGVWKLMARHYSRASRVSATMGAEEGSPR
ncbi:hypothetical protein [Aerobium aerolatum]|uniref:Uncharacterized protein n=1 Tax=Aquamicrobium aerolatum DSM 21857 TaxID=1121003 RepID=A0A1I3T4E8_9HYPH|nr:hypothetical protein [Aquamicrobium aerolatum]SFJ65510.1 hypothetical protein SAMN03080618_03563 [Aquamicrobium aerolatum DSM 21857]